MIFADNNVQDKTSMHDTRYLTTIFADNNSRKRYVTQICADSIAQDKVCDNDICRQQCTRQGMKQRYLQTVMRETRFVTTIFADSNARDKVCDNDICNQPCR
ncbi:hypothetical protein DPMN_046787 [Dreissena polymorpha]|uniref:Uncharacterized protein n=1 Tax=Dreissena polymorpha TaxID=45954 RepID=A0A9D4I182_DREPO|nr:hypothetical protein DPMN_046787 [Dreissena polymorpha]